MGRTTVIPFGPQHPVLPEPLHLKLVVEDETVVEVIPQLGFVHRGFESLFHQFWRIRERVMDICEQTAGNRVILSVNMVGGVHRDINEDQKKWILKELNLLEKELRDLSSTMFEDYTVQERTRGIGIMTKEQAYAIGAAGPTLRGSGWNIDERNSGYAAYKDLNFLPMVENDGDCYARKCPTGAITVDAKAGTWVYDPFLCVYCSACVDICPTKCLKQDHIHRKPSVSKFLVTKQGTPPKKKGKAEE